MREGWEYKKLGEVCVVTSGFTPKMEDLSLTGKYPYFKVADMNTCGNEVYLSLTNSFLSDSKKFYTKGAIVFPKNGATIATNKKRILKQDSIVDLNTAVASFDDKIVDVRFSYYWFLDVDFKDFMRGGALPTLDIKTLKSALFPLPPLTIQHSIVSELDEINNLLTLKRKELETYDKLAQSLFYEMFGDPVENEKGWEVKRIGEFGDLERGAGISKKDFCDEGFPCIHYGQLHTVFGHTTRKHITCIPQDLLPKYKYAHPGDLIMAITSEDVEGSCKSTAWIGEYDIIVGSDAAILHHKQNGTFLSYYTTTKAFFNEKAKYAKGFKVTHISTKEIDNISMFLPPLPLQQLFAQRIEAIEQQKAQVKAAIEKLETLLAARMQYWFE